MKVNSKTENLNKNLTKPKSTAHYGTAGYRLRAPDMNNVICRASLIANIRSATFAGKYIGLYITASHNPTDYNGVKFIDFNGNMLDTSWETASDEVVNAEDSDIVAILNKIIRQNSNYGSMNEAIRGNVILGRDTRESGIGLVDNIKEVLGIYKCGIHDFGVVSCPEMHYLVRKCNEKNVLVNKNEYMENLIGKFQELKRMTGISTGFGVDTANGVGSLKVGEILEKDGSFGFEVLNKPELSILNKDCGADFIKVKNAIPDLKQSAYELRASFDGDVDRLMLFDSNGSIFDGDAQCVFIAELIKKQLEMENITAELGVVLSHYSNSGAIEYLRNNGYSVVLAQTGVKNFVREARKYDIGIYFEPNGHGSVTFSKKVLDKIDDSKSSSIIKILSGMFDPCVGDALANLLVFKGALKSSAELKKYKEKFSRLMTVQIANRDSIKVDQNNMVIHPDFLQPLIDEQILLFKGRAFVRPSGTEDLVRVFSESSVEADCDKLILKVAQIVYDNCNGIGNHPSITYKNE